MPWLWWNTEDNHANHSRWTSLLPQWTLPSHQTSSSMVPLSLTLPIWKPNPYFPFIIVLEAKVLLGSCLIHPFFVHVSIHGVIVSEYIPKWGLNHIRQASFCDLPLNRVKNLFRRTSRLFSTCSWIQATAVFASCRIHVVPFAFKISLVPWLASYNNIAFHACRVDNSLTCFACLECLAFLVPLDLQGSWIRNDLIREYPVDHVVLNS